REEQWRTAAVSGTCLTVLRTPFDSVRQGRHPSRRRWTPRSVAVHRGDVGPDCLTTSGDAAGRARDNARTISDVAATAARSAASKSQHAQKEAEQSCPIPKVSRNRPRSKNSRRG